MLNDPEQFWAALLSTDPAEIRRAWAELTPDEAAEVRAHLERMVSEEGYAEVQRQAAQAALRVIAEAQ